MPTADPVTWLTPVVIARELACHPSAPVRWIQDGIILTSGERLRLEAVRTPGGWRVRRDRLDRFLGVITEDRLRPDQPADGRRARSMGVKRVHQARVEAELKRARF
jgi:hypothetical protein